MGTLELSNLIQLEINENLRNISIPKKGVVFGVDGDIEVNRVAFVFPRYYSNFDMTEFSARVNYVNANGEANYYEADDMSSDDGDTATFSWLMTSDVTSYIGEVRFSVLLYKRLDERYVKKFGTRPATGRVLEGLDVESYVTPEQQLTLIEKMEKKFDAYVEAKMLSVNHNIEDAKNGALDAIEEAKNDVDSFITSSKSEIDSLLSSSLDDIKNLTDTSKLNISTLTDEKLASLDKETVRQLKNIELAGVEETEKIRTAFSSAVSDIQTEGQKQADAVDSHGDSKIKEINDSTATSLASINSISEKQVKAIQLEGTKQMSSVSSEGNKQVSTVTSAGATEVTKVKKASSTALSDIGSAKESSISEITAKGTERVKIIKDTSTSEISKVQAAGTSQVKSVSDEGKIQIDGVKSEGEKQVQLVSAKGTQSLRDIDTAKTAAVKSVNDQTKPIIDKVEQLKQNVNDKSDSVDETYEQMKKLHCIEISEEAPTNERTGLWVNPESNKEINIPEIKDEEVSGIDTWSSQKINHEIDSLKEDLSNSNLIDIFEKKITTTTDKWDRPISFRHIWFPFTAKVNCNIKSISFNCLVNNDYIDSSNKFHCELLRNDGKTIIASATTGYEWVNNSTFVNFSFDLNGMIHKGGNYYLHIYCLTRSFSYTLTGYKNVYEDDYILSSPPTRVNNAGNATFEQSGTNDMIRLFVSMSISGKNITDISEIKDNIVNVKSDISEIKGIEPIKLYVSKSGSDITGDGSKEKPYASIFHANESIIDSSAEKPYKIIVAKGTYTDLQEKYAGDTTTGSYKGVNVKDHIYIESEDIEHPELTVLEWDGFTGFTSETYTEKIRSDMCLFHFNGRKASRKWASGLKGFTLRGSNTRYLFHIESNSEQNLEIENCIFDWNGTPKGQYHNIPVVGCGGSFNQTVTFKNCIFRNSESTAGVQWHDNAYPYSDLNIYHGASFSFIGCKFDELDLQMRSTNPNRDMPFSLIIEKCGGIRKAVFSKGGSATKNYWRGHVIASFIGDDKISNATDETNEATPFILKTN